MGETPMLLEALFGGSDTPVRHAAQPRLAIDEGIGLHPMSDKSVRPTRAAVAVGGRHHLRREAAAAGDGRREIS